MLQSVTFDGSGSFHLDPFGSIVDYSWDFDDDGVFGDKNGAVVDTSFAAAGLYPVALQVVDQIGLSDTATGVLEVVPEPCSALLLSLGIACLASRRSRIPKGC